MGNLTLAIVTSIANILVCLVNCDLFEHGDKCHISDITYAILRPVSVMFDMYKFDVTQLTIPDNTGLTGHIQQFCCNVCCYLCHFWQGFCFDCHLFCCE